MRFTLISDAHYVGICSSTGNGFHQYLLDLSNKAADVVIVTNAEHRDYVRSIGGNAVVCEDPLPDIARYCEAGMEQEKSVYYICSFDSDEPYVAAFEAAELLGKDGYRFYVTGNYKRVKIVPSEYEQVTFLGYVSRDEYYKKLYGCSVALDLTTNDNCLVCGAYEAMVAEKPLVTSDTTCLKNFFSKGTVFTSHSAVAIAEAVRRAYQNRTQLQKEIAVWKEAVYDRQRINKSAIFRELGVSTG